SKSCSARRLVVIVYVVLDTDGFGAPDLRMNLVEPSSTKNDLTMAVILPVMSGLFEGENRVKSSILLRTSSSFANSTAVRPRDSLRYVSILGSPKKMRTMSTRPYFEASIRGVN